MLQFMFLISATMKCQFPEYEESFIKEFTGYYPDQIIEEQNEDLDNLSDVLKSLGVVVHRPDTLMLQLKLNLPHGRERIGTIIVLEI